MNGTNLVELPSRSMIPCWALGPGIIVLNHYILLLPACLLLAVVVHCCQHSGAIIIIQFHHLHGASRLLGPFLTTTTTIVNNNFINILPRNWPFKECVLAWPIRFQGSWLERALILVIIAATRERRTSVPIGQQQQRFPRWFTLSIYSN